MFCYKKRGISIKTKSIKYNFVMNSILTASSILFSLITYPYILRVLGVVHNGQLSFATSVVSYFSMFASLGIPTYGIRVCAQVRDSKIELSRTVHELLTINIISTVIIYGVFFLSLIIVPNFREEKELLLINSLSLILNTIGVSWFYSAIEQYSYITVRSLIFKVISVVFMFLLVHKKADYLVYAFITVLATGGSNILNFIHLRKFITFKLQGQYNILKHLKPIFLFFGAAVASSIYTNLDMVLLGFLSNKTEVGYYQLAVKVKILLVTVVTSLGVVLLPRLSYYIQQNQKKDFKNVTVKAFNFMLIITSGIVAYFILFAKETVLVLGGEEYLGAIFPLRLVMISVLFIGFSHITGLQLLVPLGKEKQMLISYIVASAVDLIANLISVPILKATGAAMSTTLAELCVVIIQCFFLRNFLRTIVKEVSVKKTLISILAAGIVVVFIDRIFLVRLGISSLLILIITVAVFFSIYFISLLLLKEPFAEQVILPLFKRFLPKNRDK